MARKQTGEPGTPLGPVQLGSIKVHEDIVGMLRIIADAEDKSIADIASSMLRDRVEARYEIALDTLHKKLKEKKAGSPGKGADR